MDEYLKQITQLISEKTGMELDEISEDSYFEDDLNMGEMDLVDLLTDLEEIYQTEGLLEEKENIETVQDLIDILIEKVE
jgi:acyl carrier protein